MDTVEAFLGEKIEQLRKTIGWTKTTFCNKKSQLAKTDWFKYKGGSGGEEFGCQKPVEKEQVGNKQQADLKKLENIFFN